MIKSKKKTIELLSPAGDHDCFMAAIKAGADAVYLAGNKFGARAYAGNLTDEELLEAIDTAHLYGRKLYLTVNTLLKNREMDELYDYIGPLYQAGLDGVIVQDMGVISFFKEAFPDLSLHASTQMAVTDVEGVRLLKDLGITRVVPARELSLKELRDIYDKTGIEVECFIHGALCYSYSGKCLFSSLVGGRSGNRGRCAQPCRLPYNNRYILSARDIMTLEILPKLIESGICSFKIEGRMKSKEYVASVTGIYRKYIDKYINDPDGVYNIDSDDLSDLEELYTRSGHCRGYFDSLNGRDMITLDKPSYNTADDDRMKLLYERYTGNEKIKCTASLRAGTNEGLKVTLSGKGHRVECIKDCVDKARKAPTDEESIRKHFDRLGDTCFELEHMDIDIDDDIFIPVSAVNSLRREIFDLLKEEILSPYRRNKPSTDDSKKKTVDNSIPKGSDNPLINVRIDNIDLLDCIIKNGIADIISLDINSFSIQNRDGYSLDHNTLKKTAERIHRAGSCLYLALPYVIRKGYFDRVDGLEDILCDNIPDGVIIDNYESLYYLKDIGYKGSVVADMHLYAMNDRAVSMMHKLGATVITYPVELNSGELNRLDLTGGEFIIYGRTPMMISAQCTEKTQHTCLKDNGVSYITDRYGNAFPVRRNCSECINTIYNCIPFMITACKDMPAKIRPGSFRIHFTVEDEKEAGMILKQYRDMFDGREVNSPIKRTLGHLKRGVE